MSSDIELPPSPDIQLLDDDEIQVALAPAEEEELLRSPLAITPPPKPVTPLPTSPELVFPTVAASVATADADRAKRVEKR